MNVLILTPDAVGSTLLQRMITIYMQFHSFDRPVINLHELTNELIKYWSPDFNRELLGKPPRGKPWRYLQSLEEVVGMLDSVDHYKVSRLAQYHIKNRRDAIEQQVPFYQYLNDNFFIISARRRNLFEFALSWCISNITKKLNVYTHEEKLSCFYDYYTNKIEVDLGALHGQLDNYQQYLSWSSDFFSVGSYYYYEDHLFDIEKYILSLPVFSSQQKKVTWQETYGIEFNDWNRCHYYSSNIGAIAMNHQLLQLKHTNSAAATTALVRPDVVNFLPAEQTSFVQKNIEKYTAAAASMEKMRELGILISPVPIKKQTLAEKMFMIKNLDQCIDYYNGWLNDNPEVGADFVTLEELQRRAGQELDNWRPKGTITDEKSATTPAKLQIQQ
jgi:hypothetical protein